MPPTDAELVRGCLTGDSTAVRALVERYQGDVFGLCVRMLRHAHDAEDACQEVFLRVFRSLKRWDNARPFRPWVLGIAVNRCRTRLSRLGNRPTLVEDLADAPAREPPRGDESEVAAAIRVAVDELRDDYKAVFVLFHEQGRSYEEIAEAIDRPVGTIKTWLHRARALILDRLKKLDLVSEATPP
ncbi:MAG TPA: RNA polymerase sigma factor [Fimbriiglobus sp.]